jgi:hypothetical protein
LYVVGLVEHYPSEKSITNALSRLIFDVAVDRVVDVRNPASHTPIKLELNHNTSAQKCIKVEEGSRTNIVHVINNPTNTAVTAEIYIDSTTSRLQG